MQRGRGEQGGDGHAAIRRVQMSLVALPTNLVALGVVLRPAVTIRGNIGEHLREALLALSL